MSQMRSSEQVDEIWRRLKAGEFCGQPAGPSPEVLADGDQRIVKIPRDADGHVSDVFQSNDGGPWTIVPNMGAKTETALIEQLDAGGKRFDVVRHDDGNWALSEEGSPSPILVLGSREEIETYVTREFGSPTWLP